MRDQDGEAVDPFDVLDVGEVEWHMLPPAVEGLGVYGPIDPATFGKEADDEQT